VRFHRFDVVSLACGLVLGGVGVAALADIQLADVRWAALWPVLLLTAGAAVLRSARHRRDRS